MTLRVELRRAGGKALLQTTFAVDADQPLTFGRAADKNRLHLPDEERKVSRQHGRIERRGDQYFLVDAQSASGTSFEGRPVSGEVPIGRGGRITVGDFEVLVAVVETGGADAAADAEAAPGDATLHSFDPDRTADGVWGELCRRYAAMRTTPAAERQAELLEAARRELRRLPPAQAAAVMKRVVARSGGGAAPAAATVAGGGGSDAEDLLQHGLAQLRRLAQAWVPAGRLDAPRAAQDFADRVAGYLQLTLPWLAECLGGRAEFEHEFGAEVTMVFQRELNPLKGLDQQELGRRLLDWSGDPDGRHLAQLGGILRDLTEHQIGVMRGVKEVVKVLRQQLSPDEIQRLVDKEAGLLTNKGTKAWETYKERYGNTLAEDGKLYADVILPAIRRGYLTSHETPPGGPGNASS